MIRLNSEYVVEVDSRNYTLKRDYKRKAVRVDRTTGEETEEDQYGTLGYYGSLRGAIVGAIQDMNTRKLSKIDCDLTEAIEIINKNNEKFSRLLNKAIKEIEKK